MNTDTSDNTEQHRLMEEYTSTGSGKIILCCIVAAALSLHLVLLDLVEDMNFSSDDLSILPYFACSSSSPSPPLPPMSTSLHLFRLNSLRLHDNPALCASLKHSQTQFKAIFILDPWFMSGSRKFGVNRWRFLIECLQDIKQQLTALNLQLYVARGLTTAVLSRLCEEWDVVHLTYQESCEPSSAVEEKSIDEVCRSLGVTVKKFRAHSLYDSASIIELSNGNPILTFKNFSNLFSKLGHPTLPLPTPTPAYGYFEDDPSPSVLQEYHIPTMNEVGYDDNQCSNKSPWVGGESEALRRLPQYCEIRKTKFKDPSDMLLDQSSLSPYIRFGCLSVRHMWHYIHNLSVTNSKYNNLRKDVAAKLLQREFYFIVASQVPNFESDCNNSICLPFPWEDDLEMLNKWRSGMTGYPWIDAAICQLHQEGWIHHHLRFALTMSL